MSLLKFFKVSVLPSIFEGDSFYYVANGDYAESYLTNSAGVPKSLGNSTMTNALIQAALANFQTRANAVEIVANVAARDAMTAAAESNLMILVVDATGDSTVGAGSALYAYAHDTTTTHKVAEYEAMDAVLNWSQIQGRPTSTAALIDDAVTKRHAHANSAVLDKLSEVGGQLQYGGLPIASDWSTKNW